MDNHIVLQNFIMFVTQQEQALLRKSISFKDLSEKEKQQLASFFTAYELHEMPKEEDIVDQITTIILEELLCKPKELVSVMRNRVPMKYLTEIWEDFTAAKATATIFKQRPTAAKVKSCLQTADEFTTNVRVLYFLHAFLDEVRQEELEQFLLFTTGSIHQPEKITISFTNLSGLTRQPIVHTCSNVLEMSTVYHTYQEFRK